MNKSLNLRVLTERFAVVRLDPEQNEPAWVGGEVTCVARTPGELSILCAEDRVPDGLRTNSGWRCLEVSGPLDFSEVGILASSLTNVLAEAGISVFVFSTFDTDYLLVQSNRLDPAIAAFEQAGHRITRPDQRA